LRQLIRAPVRAVVQARQFSSSEAAAALQVTTLGNGVTVVTDDAVSMASTLTVSVASGSRNENAANAGVTGILKKMSFAGTADRSALAIQRETERDGTSLTADADRETVTYTAKFLADNLESAVNNLSDAVTGQQFHPWEVAAAKAHSAIALSPQDAVLDALHSGAFRTTLGRSAATPDHKVGNITPAALEAFTAANFTGGNMSVVGSGVDHAALVELCEDTFGEVAAGDDVPAEAASYYGGFESRVDAAGDNVLFGIAYEGAAAGASNAAAVAVLAEVLGAEKATKWGSSSSANKLSATAEAAGGSVTSFNESYSDAGLVGVIVAAPSDSAGAAVHAVASALAGVLGGDISPEDVTKAKNKLALSLFDSSAATSNAVVAAQLLSTKQPSTIDDLAAAVSAVTVTDVLDAAAAVGASSPTVAAFGNVAYAPYADEIGL